MINIDALDFHVQKDDYFGTLATILSLYDLSSEEAKSKILPHIIAELNYLQDKYCIKKKAGM